MIKLTNEFIINAGPNAAAVKNGSALVKKDSFNSLHIDQDETIIFGLCQGSGKNPYVCSVDFIDSDAPVFRCSCPSRQIPCKHVLGLMLAYVEGLTFNTENIPEDIIQKRENQEKRQKKKQEKQKEGTESLKVNKTDSWKKTAVKKIETQINGLHEGKKLLKIIVETGLGSIDAKAMSGYLSVVKQLDSYYISGIQNEFSSLLELIKNSSESEYTNISIKICRLQTLLNKSVAYLEKKKTTPDNMDTSSEIEELIGYPWKLEELKQYGLVEENAKLVQLAFHVVNEPDKKQIVDIGYFINLNSGIVCLSKNYRPYKAAKHIKEDNSLNSVINTNELFIYPSLSLNPRSRRSNSDFAEITPDICAKINGLGNDNFPEAIKSVKNQLKNLLLDPLPIMLMKFSKIYKATESDDHFIIEDKTGNKVLLSENKYFDDNFIHLLNNVDIFNSPESSILAAFFNDISTGVLAAHPLALVTNKNVVKLLY